MKKYQIFLATYLSIQDEKERLGFMRGYMLSLTPKQFQIFFDRNTAVGISAVKELATEDKNDTSVDEIINLAQRLKTRYELQVQPA